jgi:hypothetical protein
LFGAAFFIAKASLTGVADATLACEIMPIPNNVAAIDIAIVFDMFTPPFYFGFHLPSILFLGIALDQRQIKISQCVLAHKIAASKIITLWRLSGNGVEYEHSQQHTRQDPSKYLSCGAVAHRWKTINP